METIIDRWHWAADVCSWAAAREGLPPELLTAQMLFASIGTAGPRLTWARNGDERRWFGSGSVTILGDDPELPLWFTRNVAPLVAWQERARAALKFPLLPQPTAEERAVLNDQAAMVRDWMPRVTRMMVGRATEEPRPLSVDFLIEVGRKPLRADLRSNQSGRDRLVLLKGAAAFHAIQRRNDTAVKLRQAAVEGGPGLRTTFHGWSQVKSFRKLMRSLPVGEVRCFGWLLPSRRLPVASETVPADWCEALTEHYRDAIDLRISAGTEPFQPEADIAALLDQADQHPVVPSWCASPVLKPLLKPDRQLAWMLAAQIHLMARHRQPDHERCLALASFAADLAGWIRTAHQQELRVLYAGPPDDPRDVLSCRIADRLQRSPHTVRDLVRAFHGDSTEEVRRVLVRMEGEGWVNKDEGGRWQTCFPGLPDLSANLSAFVNLPCRVPDSR